MINPLSSITIVGTVHVSKGSIEEIKQTIQREKPKFVAIELDQTRFESLKFGGKDKTYNLIAGFGIRGSMYFNVLSFIQRELGKKMEVMPGSELLAAVRAAKEVGAEVVFIDQDINITFKKIAKEVPLGEKMKLLGASTGIAKPKFSRLNIGSIPTETMLDYLVKVFKEEFPHTHRILVEERNQYMADQLSKLSEKGKIVAVVGLGHKKGLIELIKKQSKFLDILFLYSDQCPFWEEGFSNVSIAVKKLGLRARIQRVRVSSLEAARKYNMFGTPTIQIEGVDIQKKHNPKPFLGCRFYYYDGKMHHNPAVEEIQEAIHGLIGLK